MSEQISLQYLLSHLHVASLHFTTPAALVWLALLPVFMWRRPRTRAALWLRIAAFVLVVLALAGLRLSALLPQSDLAVIAAVDLSDSIDAKGRDWARRYVERLARALPPNDQLGVLQFGGDVAVLQPPGSAAQLTWTDLPVSSRATNLAAAIESALALFPPDSERRLLLLTDGNETDGNSIAKLAAAKLAHTAIFAAVPPREGGPDVAIDKVSAPAVVTDGSLFTVRVVVRNDASARPATLELRADGEAVGRETFELQAGHNAVEIPYVLHGVGARRLRARIDAAGDTIPGNNERAASITVSGKTRVLVLTPRRHSPLAIALQRKGMEAVLGDPAKLPANATELAAYHVVVLDGVTAKSLGGRSLDALEAYVRDLGGGLVVAGGDAVFGDKELKQTALERVLPVTLEPHKPPKREREPLALFLLIDRSKSMGYHFRNRFEFSDSQSKLVYAKRAALSVVRQLRDSDQLGVIAFDSLSFELAPLRPLRDNRVILERDVPRVQVGGGTDFYDALQSALRQLRAARSSHAHVILITDGNTNRPAAEHEELIGGLARAKISVTTIRIGDDQEDLSLLKKISQRTGGAFYQVQNAETLPELLLRDASRQVMQTPQGTQTFVPRLDTPSPLLRGITPQEIPTLTGYASTRARSNADVLLHIATAERKEPLLATWKYGLGRVVAFTADPRDDAAAWVGWEGFTKLWSQVARGTAPAQTATDYAVRVQRLPGVIELDVEAFSDLGGAVLTARLGDGSQPWDVPLAPSGPRRFQARLPQLAAGPATLTLSLRQPNGEVRQRNIPLTIPSEDDGSLAELQRLQPNLLLLQRLSSETGGSVDVPIRTLVGREAGTRRVDHNLDGWLLPLAMLLFLTDVALRRRDER